MDFGIRPQHTEHFGLSISANADELITFAWTGGWELKVCNYSL